MRATVSHSTTMAAGSNPRTAPGNAVEKTGFVLASLLRLRHAFRPAILFAPCYAAAVAGAVALHLVWREQAVNTRVTAVLILFALGALIAGFLSWLMAAMVAGNRPVSARFAAMMVLLAVSTAGLTAFLFFLQFRVYYAQWHASELTLLWLYQLAFTGASAVYIFMSSGLRMLLPFGLPVLFGAAYLFARRQRD